MIVNVSEAKAKLSELINLAFQGEAITIAKNNKPMVDLVVHKTLRKPRKFGLLEGKSKTVVPDDFCDESEAINEMFYGSDDKLV